jgi:hypothetical protein
VVAAAGGCDLVVATTSDIAGRCDLVVAAADGF